MSDAAVAARTLRDFADLVDRGPDVPLKPSIFSTLAREKADDFESGEDSPQDDVGGPSSGLKTAVIEIIESGAPATADTDVIVPTDVRINGQSLACSAEHPIKVHEIEMTSRDIVCVTLTLFARRVVMATEGDLTAIGTEATA